MITVLKVILWDEEIGRLVWDTRRKISYLNYNARFIKKGLETVLSFTRNALRKAPSRYPSSTRPLGGLQDAPEDVFSESP